MTVFRRAYRLLLLSVHVLAGIVLTLLLAPRDSGRPFTPTHRAVIRWWHRTACRILGIDVSVEGSAADVPTLLVSNHISWLDIPVIGGYADICFLSKDEVRNWPVIGWLAAKSGTLFIRRGGKNAANSASEMMTFQLLRGRSVLIFPEGTTTDGTAMRRFHPRLFAAAQLADRPVQPVALSYPHEEEGIDPVAPFVGDDSFPAHLWRVLGNRRMQTQIVFCPPLSHSGLDRRALAEQAQSRVADALDDRHPGTQGRDGA